MSKEIIFFSETEALCTKCDTVKSRSEFHVSSRTTRGCSYWCKGCTAKRTRERNGSTTRKVWYKDESGRVCSKCEIYKNYSEFSGVSSWCKECCRKHRSKSSVIECADLQDFSVYKSGNFIGFSEEIHELISKGIIKSRRALWPYIGGKTKEKRQWLNKNGVLMPTKANKTLLRQKMLEYFSESGELPKASTIGAPYLGWAIKLYGTWNDALLDVFGTLNQARYSKYSEIELCSFVLNYVLENKSIPSREVFDGKELPYFETYYTRLKIKPWSKVVEYCVPTFLLKEYSSTYGTGKSIYDDGVYYYSSKEHEIGKFLKAHDLTFSKEVDYLDDSGYLFDFCLTDFDVYIEYYGLATESYLNRVKEKRSHYGACDVIEVFKNDYVIDILREELQKRNIIND